MTDNRHWRNQSNSQWGHRHQEHALKKQILKKRTCKQGIYSVPYTGSTTKYQFIKGRHALNSLCYV